MDYNVDPRQQNDTVPSTHAITELACIIQSLLIELCSLLVCRLNVQTRLRSSLQINATSDLTYPYFVYPIIHLTVFINLLELCSWSLLVIVSLSRGTYFQTSGMDI